MAREVVLPPVDATPEQIAMALVSASSGRIREKDRDPNADSRMPDVNEQSVEDDS